MEKLNGIFNYSNSTYDGIIQILQRRLTLSSIKLKKQHPSFDRCCSPKHKLD